MEAKRSAALAFVVALWLGVAPASVHAQPAPNPTTPTATATPTPTVTPTATLTPTATSTPVATPTPFVSGVPCATDDPSNERVQRSERHGDDNDEDGDEFRSGNGVNSVILHNCTDNRLRVRAAIQLNTIPGHRVAPLNQAYAEGSCSECQTLAIALQIDLYSADRANDIEPQNYAVAINNGCTRCVTVARAVQFVQGVDKPHQVSRDISDTIEELSDELTSIQNTPCLPGQNESCLLNAESRINSVLERFVELGLTLSDQREERDD